MIDDAEFFRRPLFLYHVKKILLWPVDYYRYRKRRAHAKPVFERQKALALESSFFRDLKQEQQLEKIAREVYESPPIKAFGEKS